MQSFEQALPFSHSLDPDQPKRGEWQAQRITPVGRLEVGDVATSLFDAVAAFSLITIAGIGICWYADLPFAIAPSAGLATALWRYFSMINLAKSLLEKVETVVNHDLDQNGYIGPPPDPQTVRVEFHSVEGDGSRWQFADLNVTPPKLRAFAKSILAGDSFSERTATAAGMTQAEFNHLRDRFIDRGWAVWNHPTRRQQGVSLTRGGNFIFRHILSTPLPQPVNLRANGQHARTQQHAARNYEFIKE